MSIWLLSGGARLRIDGFHLFRRPPVVAPPRWAIAERVRAWSGLEPDEESRHAASGWQPRLEASLPPAARRIVLVAPDATRVGAWRRILPDLLELLVARFPTAARTLVVATGMHALPSDDEIRRHLVPDPARAKALDGFDVVQNGADRFARHVSVGVTPLGTPVRLHPEYVAADLRIGLSDTSFHYLAGYGGGPKLTFPGCAEPEGAAINHRRAIEGDSPSTSSRVLGVGPGRLDGNPVHEDIVAAHDLCPLHLLLVPRYLRSANPDPSSHSTAQIAIEIGEPLATLREAARHHDEDHRVAFTAMPRVFLADAGGAPRDSTFLQAHKSLQHASHFVAPGGRILLLARAGDGWGSEFLERVARGDAGEGPTGLQDASVLHLQTWVALREVLGRFAVALWSDLPPREVARLGMRPIASEAEARAFLLEGEPEPIWGWLPRSERFLPQAGWLGGGRARTAP